MEVPVGSPRRIPGSHPPGIPSCRSSLLLPVRCSRWSALPLRSGSPPDRRQLPEPFQSRAALTFLPPFEPPRTETEQILADTWADVLELDEVGLDDDFFLVGGDSLRSVSVLERLRRHGIALDAGQFFAHPTIRELAAAHEGGAVRAGRAERAPWN